MLFVTNKKRTGLTFIELFLVIIIIGILSAVSIPRFKSAFDNFELDKFVKDIYCLSRYLQVSAIGQGKIYYLYINKESGIIQAKYKDANNSLENISGRFGKEYAVPKGVDISIEPQEKDLAAGAGAYFYPDGSVEKITVHFTNEHEKKTSLVIKGALGEIKIE